MSGLLFGRIILSGDTLQAPYFESRHLFGFAAKSLRPFRPTPFTPYVLSANQPLLPLLARTPNTCIAYKSLSELGGSDRGKLQMAIRQTHQFCEKCGAVVFFIKFKNGGGAFFDRLGRPWTRHGCLKAEEIYDPFTARRVPRLKLVKSEYERDGWTPLFNVRVEIDMVETVIKAQSFDATSLLTFSADSRPYVDTTSLTYYRNDPDCPGRVEIDYFDEMTGSPKTLFAKRLS